MTTAVLGSSSGIAGGPSGLSGGPSGADCGCGCGPLSICDCLLTHQPCVFISESGGNLCDLTGNVCFEDASFFLYEASINPATGECYWLWIDCCGENVDVGSVYLGYTTSTGVFRVINNAYQFVGTTSAITCVGGVLTGSVVLDGILYGPGSDCTGLTATATFGSDGACCAGGPCWAPILSCIGDSPANTFMLCSDGKIVGTNTFSYDSYTCLFLGNGAITSLPMGATVKALADVTVGTGDCSGCVSPCYVQARLCACDTTSTGGTDQGELVDAWFTCDDTPAGNAFFVDGIGCCYLQRESIFGPNPGYPDGNSTLGGTLYASTDVTPYSNCAVCMETLGCIFGTGDYESWDDFISGGVPMYGFNQSYPVNGNYLVQFLTGPACAGDVILSCSGAISGDITADPSTPCQWAGTFTIGACSVTIQVFYSSGWKARFNGGANGTYTVNINAPSCTPVGPYADGGGCIDFESILTAITDFVVG